MIFCRFSSLFSFSFPRVLSPCPTYNFLPLQSFLPLFFSQRHLHRRRNKVRVSQKNAKKNFTSCSQNPCLFQKLNCRKWSTFVKQQFFLRGIFSLPLSLALIFSRHHLASLFRARGLLSRFLHVSFSEFFLSHFLKSFQKKADTVLGSETLFGADKGWA